MREMAAPVQVEPQRISFHTASYAIVELAGGPSLDSAGTYAQRSWQGLLAQSRFVLVLPPRRTGAASWGRQNALQIPLDVDQRRRAALTDWHWAQAAFSMAAAGFINAPSNALFKTEQPALIAKLAFHAHLASRIVVQVGCPDTPGCAKPAAINPSGGVLAHRWDRFLMKSAPSAAVPQSLPSQTSFPSPRPAWAPWRWLCLWSGSAV